MVHVAMVRLCAGRNEWQDCPYALSSCHGTRTEVVGEAAEAAQCRSRGRGSRVGFRARRALRGVRARPFRHGDADLPVHGVRIARWAALHEGQPLHDRSAVHARRCRDRGHDHRAGVGCERADLARALRAVAASACARGAHASLCSGAFVLAAAGLLDGRRATTHWMWADELRRRYPQVEVDPSVLYIDEGNVLTSAGTAAAIDLCLYMVRQDHGAEVANVFARRMIVPPHREGGQAQFVEAPIAACDCDELAATLDWAVHHLDQDLTVAQLAERARMSPRTFARRFCAATGTTPLQWLLQQRVLAARRMLESTDLSVDHVADRCGFGAASTLRMHFRRITGTTPHAYRDVPRCLTPRSDHSAGARPRSRRGRRGARPRGRSAPGMRSAISQARSCL